MLVYDSLKFASMSMYVSCTRIKNNNQSTELLNCECDHVHLFRQSTKSASSGEVAILAS